MDVEYAVQKIAEMFQLSEEEKRQLLHFRDAMKQLLMGAQRRAKAKLTALYKAVAEGTYRLEGNKLYAPDGTWSGAYSTYSNPRRERLGAFSRRIEASAGKAGAVSAGLEGK